MQQQQKLNRKQRRLLRKNGGGIINALNMIRVEPLTYNQERAYRAYKQGKNLFLHGSAGTGKTFSAIHLGLKEVLAQIKQKLIIVRSVVPSRDMGFLPGTQKEKTQAYELPYNEICSELFERHDAYDILKQKEQIDFVSTSYMRGVTMYNSVMLIDEIQNMNWQEISTVLTRVGENCRVIACGDTKQSDLHERDGKHDLLKLMNVCDRMKNFEFVDMQQEDIVRSGFVKDFIVHCEELGY
jgi:phosphate starvation-inducible PhoH-like protein